MSTVAVNTVKIDDAYPLAALQAGMLFRSEYEAHSAIYHDVLTLVLSGPFDQAEFADAVDELVARHAILRTSFALEGFSESLQLVHASVPTPLTVVDWADIAPDRVDAELEQWREQEKYVPFNPGVAPLLRIVVHLLPDSRFAVSLSFHHAIMDGWSLGRVVTELLRRYTARLDGEPLPVRPPGNTFRDFVAEERAARDLAESAQFWSGVVEGAPLTRMPRLPGYPSADEPVNEVVTVPVEPTLLAQLADTAEQLGTSLRSVLLAAHLRVVGLLSAETDVTTGIVTHGRAESAEGAEVVGLFLNTVPLRVALDVPQWTTLVKRVDHAERDVLPHRRFPHFEIGRLAGRPTLFDTLFDYRDLHVYHDLRDNPRLELVGRGHVEHIDIPLIASFIRSPFDDVLSLELKFSRREFPREQVETIGEHYLTALRALAADPGGDPRPTTPYLGGRRQAAPAVTHAAAGQADQARTLVQLLARNAERLPDTLALTDGTTRFTYRQLDEAVRQRAGWLHSSGITHGDSVAVYLPRSLDLVVSMLAVLHAGACVIPLQTDHPEQRTADALADAAADALLSHSNLAGRLTFGGTVLLTDEAAGAEQPTGGAFDPEQVAPTDLAYVMTTSGSTGRPKCVELTHAALAAFAEWFAAELQLGTADVMAQCTGAGFDAAVLEMYSAMAAGCALAVVPADAVVDSELLAGFLAGNGVTAIFQVPTMLGHHLGSGTFRRTPALRTVVAGGEAVPQAMADALAEQSAARLYVAYGPTEGAVAATGCWTQPGEPGPIVPIGRAATGTTLHVVDSHGWEQPVGVPGELLLGGANLAVGYRGRPGLTAASFVPDHLSGAEGARLYRTGDRVRRLPDGRLEFLGRVDRQCKIRGVRVELDEVEGAIQQHPLVRSAAVAVHQPGPGQQVLVGYVVWREGPESPADLLQDLRKRLPEAMIPSTVVTLDALPELANGKIDRAALPVPKATARQYAQPRDEVEARLARIWEEILGVETVGARDDFFELGGHSLLALRLTMRLRREFDREIPVSTIIEAPTVERLAAVLRSPEDLVPSAPILTLREGGAGIPLILHHGLGGQIFFYQPLAKQLAEGRSVLGVPSHGFAPGDDLVRTMEEIASTYADHIRMVQPHGPYVLGGLCVGGNIALEVARRLRAAGEKVPLVVMFFSHAFQPVLQETLDDDTTLMMYALAGGPVQLDHDAVAHLEPHERMLAVIEAASTAGNLFPNAADTEQAQRMLQVYRANAHAIDTHDHQPYDGDVLLLVPSDDPGFKPDDLFGWPDIVTGTVRRMSVPGDRYTCLSEPLVTETAAMLREVLDKLDARHTSAPLAGAS